MKLIIILFSFLSVLVISAQEVVSSQGESYASGNGKLDFTIGEVVIETATDGSTKLTQGFHQSKWAVVGIKDHKPSFEAVIFPNPIATTLNIRTSDFKDVSYAMYDVQGRLVAKDKLDGEQTSISVSELAQGSYSLILKNGSKILKTVNLIKSN